MKNFKGILFALISSSTFGLIPLFSIPLIEKGIGVPSILFYRFLFSATIIGGVCLSQKKNLIIPFKKAKILFILGFFYAATAMALIFSYKYIPSGVATTIHFLYPILVAFIMVILFKEKKSISLFFSAVLSIIGVALLCWTENSTLNPIGILIALITIVTYAIYIVGVNKSKIDKIHPLVITFYILLSSAILFTAFAFSTGGIDKITQPSGWINLILLALLPTVVSGFTLVLAIKNVGSTVTSILGSMEPLVAVCVGIFFFSEVFGLHSFVGLFLILFSVILVIVSR